MPTFVRAAEQQANALKIRANFNLNYQCFKFIVVAELLFADEYFK